MQLNIYKKFSHCNPFIFFYLSEKCVGHRSAHLQCNPEQDGFGWLVFNLSPHKIYIK